MGNFISIDLDQIINYEKQGKMVKALDKLEMLKIDSEDMKISIMLSKNRMLVCQGSFERAQVVSNELQQIIDQHQIESELERLTYIALSFFFQDKLSECRKFLDLVEQYVEKSNLNKDQLPLTIKVWINTVEGFYDEAVGEFNRALEYLTKARESFTALGQNYYLSVVYGHLGRIHQQLGDYNSAEQNFGQERIIALQIKDDHRLNRAIHNLGGLFWKTNRFPEALEAFKEGLALTQASENDFYLGELLFHMIILSFELDDQNPPLDLISMFSNHVGKSKNSKDKIRFQIVEAWNLKSRKRLIEVGQAQQIIRTVLKEPDLNYELSLLCSSALITLLIDELKVYPSEEILGEINELLSNLEVLAKAQNSHTLLIDTMILKSKLRLIEGEFSVAAEILDMTKTIAERENIAHIIDHILDERKKLENELVRWKDTVDNNMSLTEKVKMSQFTEYLSKAIELKDIYE